MAQPGLTIEIDEPGSRLVLGSAPPPAARAVINAVVLAFLSSVAVTIFWKPALLLAYVLGGVVIGLAASRMRVVTRLAFDRTAGHIEVTTLGPVRSTKVTSYPLSLLSGMEIEALRPPPALPGGGSAEPVRLRLRLRYSAGFWTKYATRFSVERVDTLAEAGDLARRLAAAAAFGYEGVVRSDPRELTWDFRAAAAPGFSPVPDIETKADYHHDRLSQPSPTAAPRERTDPFAPASFKSDFRVEAWGPGQEVRFERPFRFTAIGCLPGVGLAFAGPAAFVVTGEVFGLALSDRVLIACVSGVFGLIFAGAAAFAVYQSLPRTIVFDWAEGRLEVAGLFRRRAVAFPEIRAVGMMGQRMRRTQSTKAPRWTYECEVSVFLGAPGAQATPLVLLSTRGAYDDPETPYRACLPLATELAKALGVARHLGNYAEAAGQARATPASHDGAPPA
jgi:hypothetical protein